jgi:peptide/nickel transport system permease protein
VLLGLVALEIGAVVDLAVVLLQGAVQAYPLGNPYIEQINGAKAVAESIPTLLSRETIPNQGYRTSANGPWKGTFLGLEPMAAWLVRFSLTYAYAGAVFGWTLYGYRLYRRHYRRADWTPTDDVIRRFRAHSWGKFGLIIVLIFVVMAVFAPTLSTTTVERNVEKPYSYTMEYFDEETGSVEEIYVGDANSGSTSQGAGDDNVGLWQYDAFDRFHPFGTLPNGKDLFTFMMYGARVSLFIGLLSMAIMGCLAATFAMVTAYYKGLIDLSVVIVGDSVMAIPQLLLLILVKAVFNGHWLDSIYNGGLLIALVFGFTGWPALWRAVRGPAFQVSTEEWVDAARSFGQRPRTTMRKHMFPYVVGYLLVYASMTLGGVIISTAALSFLGIGIDQPTPEWGTAVARGQPFIATQSWHIAMIPGVMVVAVVTAFNALGDGIRDAIDPQSEGAESETSAAAAGGGGG